MGLLRLDPGGQGVGNNTTTLLNGGFNNFNSFVGLTNTAPAGRSDTLAYTTSTGSAFIGWTFANNQECIFGHAYYNNSATAAANARICTFADNGTNQCDVRTDASGHLFIAKSSSGAAISSSSSQTLTATGWYYIEFKAKIASGTSGSAEVRVKDPSGVTAVWCTCTGVNTQSSGNAFANQAFLVPRQSGVFQVWKDIYVLETALGINKTYLGDTAVKVRFANAAGTNQQWAPNTGTQTAAVQDGFNQTGTFPDGDTTYISDTVAGHISDFVPQTISASSIAGIIHASYARTTSAGSINQVLVQSGSVVETSAAITLTTSYKWYFDILEQNPTGPATWNSSSLNATNMGVKMVSGNARSSQEFFMAACVLTAGNKKPMTWITT